MSRAPLPPISAIGTSLRNGPFPVVQLADFTIATPAEATVELIGREWQARLRLQDWTIRFVVGEPSVEDAEGSFDTNDHYDDVTITVRPDVVDGDRRDLNATIVHELVHVLYRNIDTCVYQLEDRVAKTAWSTWTCWFDHARENTVEKLAQLLVDLGGVV